MSEDQRRRGLLADSGPSRTEKEILNSLRGIRFGSVEVVIHDSRVVQIERKEKFRFDTAPERHK
ncbi:MAG: YezD family protein [Candidatus Omnitrophica bacterium]|nr:hypothetical protein [bacterium]NUN97585.1 YezD family protein [Candidatus Omnitrophota bacterium]